MIRYIIFSMIFFPIMVFGQTRGASLADVVQDVALMRREIGQLRLEVEALRRENESLRARQGGAVSKDIVSAQNDTLKAEFDAKLNALKVEIATSVKKDLDNMAAQTNSAIGQVVNSIAQRQNTQTQVQSPAVFSNEYPSTGIKYIVQRGDNLSKIAKKFNSTVKWIQDANQIANPASLQVGQELLIPQN